MVQHHNDLEGSAFPDPDPQKQRDEQKWLLVDDVSQCSTTPISQLVFPRTELCVHQILDHALRTKTRIGIRGTQHSMGGHAVCRHGLVVDTQFLADMEYNNDNTVTVGTGCRWSDVIAYLNQFGKAPRTMQSYCSFSVGGTLAVNAHGITSDTPLVRDVVRLRLVTYRRDENESKSVAAIETVVCTPPANCDHPQTRGEELFGLVVGGYGLFGIVTQVTLRVVDNCPLHMDSLQLCTTTQGDSTKVEPSEFERVWEECLKSDSKVQVKLARLNILTLETASLYVFQREDVVDDTAISISTTSNLPLEPKELSKTSQLLYKWVLPVLSAYRFQVEEETGQAVDMIADPTTTTNELLFESATPLSKLYSPLLVVDDTFVLQEFFVPRIKFQEWIALAKPIYRDIHQSSSSIRLLNTTIRFVECDSWSYLRYAREDMYAFVLYFRIQKSRETDQELGHFHNRFVQATIQLGGTFYLPYRKCYSHEQMETAYPQISGFASLKEKYDPLGVFSNEWFEHYVLPNYSSATYQKAWRQRAAFPTTFFSLSLSNYPSSSSSTTARVMSRDDFLKRLPDREHRRTGSYRALLRNKKARREFAEQFLVNIFAIEDPDTVMRTIAKAAWDPNNRDDDAIYRVLYDHFNNTQKLSVSLAAKGWRSLRQLAHQKRELTRELCVILHRTGLFGRIRGYASIGDHGKIVLNLRRVGAMAIDECDACVYIVHKFDSQVDETNLQCILERGSLDPVGKQVHYDFERHNATEKLYTIPTDSMDLVTMNQGMHHIPPNELYNFLSEVYRILSPDGVFVFREHDLGEKVDHPRKYQKWIAPIEMLDLAHSVFNALTGVPPEVDVEEIRLFRSLEEWRKIMVDFGFHDTMLYDFQSGDPTQDFMLCFRKKDVTRDRDIGPTTSSFQDPVIRTSPAEMLGQPRLAEAFRAILSQIPRSVFTTVETLIEYLLRTLPLITDSVEEFLSSFSNETSINDQRVQKAASFCKERMHSALSGVQSTLAATKDLLQAVNIRETVDLVGLLSMPELFLVMPTLKRRVERVPELVSDLENCLVEFVSSYLPSLLLEEHFTKPHEPRTSLTSNPETSSPGSLHEVSPREVKEVVELVVARVPGLDDPESFLPSSGFTVTQQSALLSLVAVSDLSSLAETISRFCDRRSWEVVKCSLIGTANSDGEDTVVSRGELPTKTRLLSAEASHPWRRVLRSFLESPKVQLRPQALFGLHLLSLKDIVILYNQAKEEAMAEDPNDTFNEPILSTVDSRDALFLLSKTSAEIKTIELTFSPATKRFDLRDVGQIVKAEFGYTSLTSTLTDITAELSAHQMKVHGECARDSDGQHPFSGWLPVSEALLVRFRNQNAASHAGDALRRKVVGVGSFGFAGQNVLRLQYRPMSDRMTHVETNACSSLCKLLEQKGAVDGNVHNNPGHFTWFKLAEWMLVDIVEKLGSSLDHTPWYFFPFMDCVKTYFNVLFKESRVVSSEFGLSRAYASEAFVTDLVPGAVMALLFAQLQAMSAPLAKLFPLSQQSHEIMAEEIVFQAAISETWSRDNQEQLTHHFRSLLNDTRIRQVTLLLSGNAESGVQLYRATIPTYKTMGEILIKFGNCVPSARVLQISGHSLVQVRLSVDVPLSQPEETAHENALIDVKRELDQIDGVFVLFHYCFANDNESQRLLRSQTKEAKIHVALRVHVLSLLHLVRKVTAMKSVNIAQIYEIWTGW